MIKKVLLIILDGWGKGKNSKGNAIKKAKTPILDKMEKLYQVSRIQSSGKAVGLDSGVMGNSEVGHLNIGSGRVVYQLNSLINKQIQERTFYKNRALLSIIEHSKTFDSNIHILGLLSDGKVHSNPEHLLAFLHLCKKQGARKVFYHLMSDGRDTLPYSGAQMIADFEQKSKGLCKIASLSGRYYAMDRDNRWDRVKKAYDCFVKGIGKNFPSCQEAIKASYTAKISDEFVQPCVIDNLPRIGENDAVFFFNFRADRARQITSSFVKPKFCEFERKLLKNLKFVCLSPYGQALEKFVEVGFRLPKLENILGEVIQNKGLRQLRIAETEKYAHVTFFFNGTREEPFVGEDRVLIASPKVASYDLRPQMSAYKVRDALIEKLKDSRYDLIIANFANCDMVGHTGDFDATVLAVETVDQAVGKIIPIAQKFAYDIIITADHGNAEKMLDEKGNIFTAHSTNDVKLILISDKKYKLLDGKLGDIAPTILELMGIEKPFEMTGKSLIELKK